MCQVNKIILNYGHDLKVTYEWIGLATITLVIMSWSLILFVNGPAKL